jgi:hypothetical protein
MTFPASSAFSTLLFLRRTIQHKTAIVTIIVAPTAAATPIPALAPIERVPLVPCAASWVAAPVVDSLMGLLVMVPAVVVFGAKSPDFQRIEIPWALIPSALIVLEVVPAFVKVQS